MVRKGTLKRGMEVMLHMVERLVEIRKGVGGWFDENLGRVVGDGVNSSFGRMCSWRMACCVTNSHVSLI